MDTPTYTPTSTSPYITNYESPMSTKGGLVLGGDSIGTHTNRAVAWLVAGIVVMVIIVLIHMVACRLLGYKIVWTADGVAFENKTVAILSLLAAVTVGFSIGGSVYECWTGSKST